MVFVVAGFQPRISYSFSVFKNGAIFRLLRTTGLPTRSFFAAVSCASQTPSLFRGFSGRSQIITEPMQRLIETADATPILPAEATPHLTRCEPIAARKALFRFDVAVC